MTTNGIGKVSIVTNLGLEIAYVLYAFIRDPLVLFRASAGEGEAGVTIPR